MTTLKVLVACEFSGVVREAFKAKGHDAWSCDLLPTEIPGQHYQCDIRTILDGRWDLMIAHPPCTYVCAGSMNWLYREPGRYQKMLDSVEFVKLIMNADIPRIAVENPIGVLSTRIRKPDQIVRAWQFGHPFKKDICFWLKGLPKLIPTNMVPFEKHKTFDFWSKDRFTAQGGSKKSITFQGIGAAMAAQWSDL